MPRVYDCFQFYNEFDVLEIRLAELDPLVDHFVLVEATHTHTGKPKPLHFTENRKRYERYAHKIIHVVIDDLPLDDPSHFARDIHQREAILRGLGGAQPDDRILFSDCDEIPKPHLLRKALAFRGLSHRIVAFWCENYFYRLNLLNETFDHRLGPRLLTMSNLKSPNAVRSVQFRFSSRRYLRPVATPMAALRVRSRLGKIPVADDLLERCVAFHQHGRCRRGQSEVLDLCPRTRSRATDGSHLQEPDGDVQKMPAGRLAARDPAGPLRPSARLGHDPIQLNRIMV